MELTKKLAEFVQDTNYKDIPSEVIEKSKNCILDCQNDLVDIGDVHVSVLIPG